MRNHLFAGISFFFLAFFIQCNYTPSIQSVEDSSWPDSVYWWKRNNLRVIQVNLPAYEAATLNADSLTEDLLKCSANTLIINAGGIMAFYPTALDFHYINPFMQEEMLSKVIERCHALNIRVVVRFDFSRIHESIFREHPDWCYISPKGERIINTDMYVVSINAPYVQEKAFKIIEEVMDRFPIDGIFLNMPGYQVNNPYEGVYHGIDQNDYDKKRFAEFSGGLRLPLKEDKDDPVYQKYLEFKAFTVADWSEKLYRLVKSKNPQVAICTYMDRFVDIIRHESQTNSLPYWPYMSSDNVNNAVHSYPDHIISNASIQQISFQSRYNAVEPEEVEIRLIENIANGSGLDMSMMGDMRGYEDERNFPVFQKVYAYHKQHEPYFGKYYSVASVAVIAPGSWPSGEAMQEYRGVQLMLKEAHIQYDIIEDSQIGNLTSRLRQYRLIILPEITYLNAASKQALRDALSAGTHLVATGRSFSDDAVFLEDLFGAKIEQRDYDGAGHYLVPEPRNLFKRFPGQSMLFWKFNLGQYDFSEADTVFLSVLAKGRPGPPEIIGGHDPTGYHALGMKGHGESMALLFPGSLGKLYYLHGYEQHKNILLDIVDYVFPEASQQLITNVPERVEVILQYYIRNIPENLDKKEPEGMIMHLINLTGFSGNTYFKPYLLRDLAFDVECGFNPSRVFSLSTGENIHFSWREGRLRFQCSTLESYESIVIQR